MNHYRIIILLSICSLVFNGTSYGWWATGHALTGQVASQLLISDQTKNQLDKGLNTRPSLPVLNYQPDNKPTLNTLYQNYNDLATAATWADDIKAYPWEDESLKKHYNRLHYINVDMDLAARGKKDYCKKTITTDYIKQFNHNQTVINGVTSAIATLTRQDTSDGEKATALRFLAHLMGDLHQPLHVSNPIDDIPTYGGNKMVFGPKWRSPDYHEVIGKNPLKDVKEETFSNMHQYFDGMLGSHHQLPETISHYSYSREGFQLWSEYKPEYLQYLTSIASSLDKQEDTIKPSIVNWAYDTAMTTCKVLITDDNSLHYKLSDDKEVVFVDFKPHQFSQYDKIINRQIALGGLRLALLLEAIYHSGSDNRQVREYYQQIVKPIASNPDIVTLRQLVE